MVKSCAQWCLQRFAVANMEMIFFSLSCCACFSAFLRHPCGFKIICGVSQLASACFWLSGQCFWQHGFQGSFQIIGVNSAPKC